MAIQRRISVGMGEVFPHGAYVVGAVEAVPDFNAERRADGSRPQQVDKDTGLLMWSVPVLDADPEAGKRDKTMSVKVIAPHQPVPPRNETPFPFTPVAFEGLAITPYIDDNGPRPRIAWSLRATGLCAPGQAARGDDNPKSGDAGKAA